jgi:hypothetical protein
LKGGAIVCADRGIATLAGLSYDLPKKHPENAMPEPSQEIRFDTRTGYLQALDAVLASAKREICIFDPDLKGPDLDSSEHADVLAAFLSGGRDRSLRIVVHNADHVSRYCPRLMSLVRRFSHSLSIRRTPESLSHLADCFALADEGNAAIRFHADYFRGKLLLSLPEATQDWRQRFEALWLESLPAVSATQIGL